MKNLELAAEPAAGSQASKPERLLGKREVMDRVDLGYTTIWKLMCEGKFPHSREIAGNRVAWLESQIDEWMKTRPMRRLKGA
jgi:prophage regulatory protein